MLTFLKNLLYKPLCEQCKKPLNNLKVFCYECQNECYYRLQHASCYYEVKGDLLIFSLEKEPHLRRLFYLVQNPRNSFLTEAIISLISLKLCSEKQLWPQAIVESEIFPNKSANKKFFKELKKALSLPVIYQKDVSSTKKQVLFSLR